MEDDRAPVSVLLPTTRWGRACDQLSAMLGPADELLVLCDSESDPVAAVTPPAGVRILVAGEPDSCSGKANALALGMEAASHDRLVWTDDDFSREADWLETLIAAGETHGPATAIPLFAGSRWWRVVEPWFAVLFLVGLYHQLGSVENIAWGGGVTFTRAELTTSVSAFAEELRTVLSDDYLLTQRLETVHPVTALITHVEVPGDARSVYNRVVRFGRIVWLNEGYTLAMIATVALSVLGLLNPILTAPPVTALVALLYRRYGLRGRNYLLAWPAFVLAPLVLGLGVLVEEFEWGGRRYRYTATSVELATRRS